MHRLIFLFLFLLGIFASLPTQAVCPVCTVAVGAGVGLSRYFGIDDTIAGLWIGGLTVSLIAWTINWCNRKNIRFKGRKIMITLMYYLLIVVPLFSTGVMGDARNKLWGVDKLLLGIILGSLLFLGGALWYNQIKEKNNGHAHFPFQKVVMPISPLIIASLIFYLITK
jgi:hypothetical protein